MINTKNGMTMKRIVGLDLGTNSIGWAVVDRNDENRNQGAIVDAGCRIIPMDASEFSTFAKGETVSRTAERTRLRGTRRMLERRKLRRERLLRVLDKMKFLPPHFSQSITRFGKFVEEQEPKLAWATGSDGKPQFLFADSFGEMLEEFRAAQPEWMNSGNKVPCDWTLYYLRKKGLTSPLSPYELAWVLLSFNAKRGYNQRRDEDDSPAKNEEYVAQKVVNVIDTGEKSGKGNWFDIVLENRMVYHRKFSVAPDWVGRVKEFIVTTTTDKKGKVKCSFRMPTENDWTLQKKQREAQIEKSGLTVGEYIYDSLLKNPQQKVIGGLVSVIDREYYKKELIRILDKQKEFLPELTDKALYEECIEELYPTNEAYRGAIPMRGFTYLFVDDILFYQRPLKKKSSLISDCPFETRCYVNKNEESGVDERIVVPLKCIAKSNPWYQEFRLWQFVRNLKIYRTGQHPVGGSFEKDVTDEFLYDEASTANLFEELNDVSKIDQKKVLGHFKLKKGLYRWNYVEGKVYPGNETRGELMVAMKKAKLDTSVLDDRNKLYVLWQMLYSIDNNVELRKALTTFAVKNGLDEAKFAEALLGMKPYEKEYGAYSEKAIKKLLPLMRCGRYWSEGDIDASTTERINKLIDGEADEQISERTRKFTSNLKSIDQFRNLPLWLASYVVYGRHSEAVNSGKWTCPEDIDVFLQNFRQHSLRNPVVEMVIMETMRTVRDIWRTYGKIDEFHIELGREMKNSAEKRKKMSKTIAENESARMRAKLILGEYLNSSESKIKAENLRPYSPNQQELFRLYEEGAWSVGKEQPMDEDVRETIKLLSQGNGKKPTQSQVNRYLLWLDQRYVSPYTGKAIPLSKLFTADYEIEHIIPQSRYFDDSFSNKVICEASVNKKKDRMLGLEFIKECGGSKVDIGYGKTVEVLKPEAYCETVKELYKNNPAKMKKLLLEDIPDDFIQRQLNDSRYISKVVKSLLSNVVREEGEEEDMSKNVIACTGGITDRLKNDWGVNDAWNRIVLPRFERMNELTGRTDFTAISETGHKIPAVPLELQRGFSKKRIDHRHHAMDAIVIACATRDHVNLLNNEAAKSENRSSRQQLSRKLRIYENVSIDGRMRSVAKTFKMPWETFNADAEKALRGIVVSFKHNLRLVTKARNRYQHFDASGTKKVLVEQKGDNLVAIRKPLHKDTVYGKVNLRLKKEVALSTALKCVDSVVDKELKCKLKELLACEKCDLKSIKAYFTENKDAWSDVNLSKIEVYYFTESAGEKMCAARASVDTSFNEKKIREHVTDTGIQKIMLKHLAANGGKADVAFSPEGIEDMNKNIVSLNDGHKHQPIRKVRVYEQGNKFAVGAKGCRKSKFVEAAKGTNLFFAVYESEVVNKKTGEIEKERSFATIPLQTAIERKKQGLPIAPDNADGVAPSFVLSPNSLVYVPTRDELETGIVAEPLDRRRIYKFVNSSGTQAYFIPQSVAKVIYSNDKKAAGIFCRGDKFAVDEFGGASPMSKNERALTGEMIKKICIQVEVDRLGHAVLVQKTSKL